MNEITSNDNLDKSFLCYHWAYNLIHCEILYKKKKKHKIKNTRKKHEKKKLRNILSQVTNVKIKTMNSHYINSFIVNMTESPRAYSV